MKKKVLFGSILFMLSVTLIFNVTVAKKGHNPVLSLNSLSFCFQAQAEDSSSSCTSSTMCDDANDLQYGTDTDPFGKGTCCGMAVVTRGRKSS